MRFRCALDAGVQALDRAHVIAAIRERDVVDAQLERIADDLDADASILVGDHMLLDADQLLTVHVRPEYFVVTQMRDRASQKCVLAAYDRQVRYGPVELRTLTGRAADDQEQQEN